ncbi:hypothetical protein JL722_8262 [Aureococcus anophagefferens]|nr:hypothetical protein JL722_8262 [Aureococcus anophagefferens]
MASFRDFMRQKHNNTTATDKALMVAGERPAPWMAPSAAPATTVKPSARPRPPPYEHVQSDGDPTLKCVLAEQDAFEKRASRVNCRTSERCRSGCGAGANPRTRDPPKWKVSILCPTTPKRRKFHGLLVDNWRVQDYDGEVELVVYDTGPGGPSEVLEASGCDYTYAADCVLSLGEKRQVVTDRCTGDVCVLMDDDNIYHPNYVTTMVRHLFDSGAGLVALKGWLELHAISQKVFRIEGNRGNSRGETMVHLHPRRLEPRYGARAKYPKLNVGEEGAFVRWFKCHELDDDRGLFVHVSHGQNCASQALWGLAEVDVPPAVAASIERNRAALTHTCRSLPRPRADSDEDEREEGGD